MKRKSILLLAMTSICAMWGTVVVYEQRATSHEATTSQSDVPDPPSDLKPNSSFRVAMEAALALSVADQRAAVVACFQDPELRVNLDDAAWVLRMYLADVNQGYPRVRKEDWLGYLTKLIQRDPQVAAVFLRRHGRLIGTGADDDARCLMTEWARINPLEVITWGASGSTEGEWFRRNGQALAKGWAAVDLQGLLDYVSAGGSEPTEWTTVHELEKLRGPQALETWLEAQQHADSKLPNGMRQELVRQIAGHKLKEVGPAETAVWVSQRKNEDELVAGVRAVTPAYARQQPERAINWVEGYSAKPGFPSVSGEVAMVEFATRDLAGAGEWLNAHLDSPIVSAYIWAYAVQAALEDPAAASVWVAKLPQNGGWGHPKGTSPAGHQDFLDIVQGMEGGRTAKTLAVNIKAAARAGQMFRDPSAPLPPWEGEQVHFLRYEYPILIKASPDAAPMLQMKLHNEGGCHMIFQGTWPWPFGTFQQEADGNLTYVQPESQAAR